MEERGRLEERRGWGERGSWEDPSQLPVVEVSRRGLSTDSQQCEDRDTEFADACLLHRSRLLRFVETRSRGKLCDEPEDLVQEVFVRALSSSTRYTETGKLSGWLLGIAERLVSERLRFTFRERARRRAFGDDVDPVDEPEFGDREDARVTIHQALASLRGRERQVVELYYLRGCAMRQVASRMDVSLAAAKSLLHRARVHLRSHTRSRLGADHLEQSARVSVGRKPGRSGSEVR